MLFAFSVRVGPPDPNWRDQGFSFTLFTPERIFNLSADTSEERDEWMEVIQKVLERPLSPQDSSRKYFDLIFFISNLTTVSFSIGSPKQKEKLLFNTISW